MDTRKYDLIELIEKRRKASNAFERDMADRAISRIRTETKKTERLREKLIRAIRNRDERAQRRFEHDLIIERKFREGK